MYNPQLVIVFFSVEKNGTIFFLFPPPFGCQVIQQGVLELHYNFRSES